MRAEATLAAANLIYLVLLGIGGVLFPLTKFPASARPVLRLLPSGAMSDGLRAVLRYGAGLPGRDLLVLACWAVVGHRPGRAHVPLGIAAGACQGNQRLAGSSPPGRVAGAARRVPAPLLLGAGIISVQVGRGFAGGCSAPSRRRDHRVAALGRVPAVVAFGGRSAGRAVRGVVAERAWRDAAVVVRRSASRSA